MTDTILFIAIIPLFPIALYVVNKVFSFIWDNEKEKGEHKKKGEVHDLRDQN